MRLYSVPRVSICQFSTYQWNFNEDVVRYANLGFHSIGLWRRKLEDIGISRAADILYENKMEVSSLHWAGGFTGDGCSYPDAIEDATQAIITASRVNAKCLILHPGSRNGHTTSHATRLFNTAIGELVPFAADFGVKLVLEPIPTKRNSPWTFLDTFHQTLDILERYSSNDLGLVLDLFHLGFDSVAYEELEQIIDRIELVQLADRMMADFEYDHFQDKNETHRLLLGEGQIPLDRWFSKLQDLGYAGKFELELHGSDVANMEYFSILDSTKDYFQSERLENLLSVDSGSQRMRN